MRLIHDPTPRRRPALVRRSGGFTLVEMLTVMTLMIILLGIALPAIDVSRFRLNSEVQNVALMINTAQRLAVLRQYDIVLTFDEDESRIRLHHDENNDGLVNGGEETRFIPLGEGVVFGRGGADALPQGDAVISFTREQEGLPALTFRRNGSASEAGVIYLTSIPAARGEDLSEHTRAITIERATGQVTCLTYRTSEWEIGC